MSKEDDNGPFPTRRLQTMSGLNPAYIPGEFVYLHAAAPGFPAGTRFKVVMAQTVSEGLHRYQLSALGQTVWVMQEDVRQSPPDSVAQSPASQLPDRNFSMTQRMQTMTLSQRMAALGVDLKVAGEPDPNATQRMSTLKPGGPAVAPDLDGPVTGMPGFVDANKGSPGKR